MKKRILLILALGVSFTPAVFADWNYARRPLVVPAHTGQQALDETPSEASACNARADAGKGPIIAARSGNNVQGTSVRDAK